MPLILDYWMKICMDIAIIVLVNFRQKTPIQAALRDLILDEYVHLTSTSKGYEYAITAAGKNVCKQLHSSYSEEYCLAVKTTVSAFNHADTTAMLNAINNLTVKSLKEVTHE